MRPEARQGDSALGAAACCGFQPQSIASGQLAAVAFTVGKLEMGDRVTEGCRQQAGTTETSSEERSSKLPHSKFLYNLSRLFPSADKRQTNGRSEPLLRKMTQPLISLYKIPRTVSQQVVYNREEGDLGERIAERHSCTST